MYVVEGGGAEHGGECRGSAEAGIKVSMLKLFGTVALQMGMAIGVGLGQAHQLPPMLPMQHEKATQQQHQLLVAAG